MEMTTLEDLLAQNNEILCSIYALLLFQVGVASAVFVCYLLYKALRTLF